MDYRTIVFVGVSPDDKGGIASVLKMYREHFDGGRFFTSNARPAGFLFTCIRFCRLLAFTPEIRLVHMHGASRGSFYRKYVLFLIAKYIFRKQVVYHVHGGGFHQFFEGSGRFVQGRIRHFVDQADALICLSESWKQFFLQHFWPSRIMVLPNAVEKVTRRAEMEMGKTIFLFMGKIGERKGIYDLVKATALLKIHYEEQFEVWIGGDGNTQTLRYLIESNGLQGSIFLKGWVTGNAKEELYRKATVFVLPSYNEGLPVSVLEAMSYGMPVIATNVGGIPELVKDGESGQLIVAGDIVALRNAMERFIRDRRLVGDMGRAAEATIQQSFVFEQTKMQLDKLYTELTGTENAGAA